MSDDRLLQVRAIPSGAGAGQTLAVSVRFAIAVPGFHRRRPVADRLFTSMREIETMRMPSTSGIVIRSLKMIADWTIPKFGTRKWNAEACEAPIDRMR